jgi:hypothetical protein
MYLVTHEHSHRIVTRAHECHESERLDCGCAEKIDFSLLIGFMLQKFEK